MIIIKCKNTKCFSYIILEMLFIINIRNENNIEGMRNLKKSPLGEIPKRREVA